MVQGAWLMTPPLHDTPQSILCNVLQGMINLTELAERGQLTPTLLARCLVRWQQQLMQALALIEARIHMGR